MGGPLLELNLMLLLNRVRSTLQCYCRTLWSSRLYFWYFKRAVCDTVCNESDLKWRVFVCVLAVPGQQQRLASYFSSASCLPLLPGRLFRNERRLCRVFLVHIPWNVDSGSVDFELLQHGSCHPPWPVRYERRATARLDYLCEEPFPNLRWNLHVFPLIARSLHRRCKMHFFEHANNDHSPIMKFCPHEMTTASHPTSAEEAEIA